MRRQLGIERGQPVRWGLKHAVPNAKSQAPQAHLLSGDMLRYNFPVRYSYQAAPSSERFLSVTISASGHVVPQLSGRSVG